MVLLLGLFLIQLFMEGAAVRVFMEGAAVHVIRVAAPIVGLKSPGLCASDRLLFLVLLRLDSLVS
jgi:hypothetical protein